MLAPTACHSLYVNKRRKKNQPATMEDAATGRVTCSTCNRSFTNRGYYRAHMKYDANKQCKLRMAPIRTATTEEHASQPSDDCPSDAESAGDTTPSGTNLFLQAKPFFEAAARNFFGSGAFLGSNTQDNTSLAEDSSDEAEESDNGSQEIHNDEGMGTYNNDSDEDEESPIDTSMLEDFKQYAANATQNHSPLTPSMVAGVELMDVLIQK